MIFWTGWGILIGIAGVACLALTQLAVNAAMHDSRYYTAHRWPKLLALWLAAAVSWPLGRAMNRGEPREYFDPHTGQTVRNYEAGGHSLFFIPVQHFWIAFLILGVVFACV